MTVHARRHILAMGLVGALLLAACGDGDETTTDTSTTATTSASTSSTSTTITAPVTTTTTSAVTTTMGRVPAAVTVIIVRPGGGSGEVAVTWESVADATGYRVSRSSAPGGPFSVSADVNLATGEVTVDEGVGNLWAPGSTNFFPVLDFEVGDPLPNEYEYIDIARTAPRYFQIVAYNAAGDGPPSAVVCGTPPGGVAC